MVSTRGLMCMWPCRVAEPNGIAGGLVDRVLLLRFVLVARRMPSSVGFCGGTCAGGASEAWYRPSPFFVATSPGSSFVIIDFDSFESLKVKPFP